MVCQVCGKTKHTKKKKTHNQKCVCEQTLKTGPSLCDYSQGKGGRQKESSSSSRVPQRAKAGLRKTRICSGDRAWRLGERLNQLCNHLQPFNSHIGRNITVNSSQTTYIRVGSLIRTRTGKRDKFMAPLVNHKTAN